MKILFICFSTLKFNVRTPLEEPLGGTESAACYLSVQLAKLGHDVMLMRNADNSEPQMLEDVRHLKMTEDVAGLNPDVVVLLSAPQAAPGVRKLIPGAKIIVWNHMLPDQPAMAHLFDKECLAEIDDIVYVSESQRAAFTSLPNGAVVSAGAVIGNAISPRFQNLFSSAQDIFEVKECKGAYTSTPYRGAAILASIKEIPIDVYSSMRVYQANDVRYEKMFTAMRANDCLTLHGSLNQSVLATRLLPAAFLVYPSIFTECHSIAIIEAMAAGLKVITTSVAHPQTDFVDSLAADDVTLESYTTLLRKNINYFRSYPEEWAEKIWKQVQYVNTEFTWAKRASQWTAYLQILLAAPT